MVGGENSLLLVTLLKLMRKSIVITTKEEGDPFVREYTQFDGSVLKVTVTLIVYVIDHRLWFLPKFRQKQYKAQLSVNQNGKWTDHESITYPALSLSWLTGPAYPLSCVAAQHVTQYYGINK